MLGDYTAPQEEANIKTVLDGIRTKLSSSQVEYVKGCSIRDTVTTDIEQAVAAAQRSEIIIAVVGGSSARDFKTSYKETGAAIANEKDDQRYGMWRRVRPRNTLFIRKATGTAQSLKNYRKAIGSRLY